MKLIIEMKEERVSVRRRSLRNKKRRNEKERRKGYL